MKRIFYTFATLVLLVSIQAKAQSDPVVMRIAGEDVPRSEFEYNYNKNNSDGVIDKKTVEEYVDLFINYKLKVKAALDAKLDTMSSYQKEFRTYRDQQIRPLMVPEGAEEREAVEYYDNMLKQLEGKELIQPAHIFVHVQQQATSEQQASAKARIDSIYAALEQGEDFAALAQKHSEDRQTGIRSGIIGWIGPHQLLKELEDAAYALEKGEVSKPFLSTVGWHIMKLMDKKPLEPYDTLAPRIRQFLEARGVKEKIATQLIDSLSKSQQKSIEEIMDEASDRYAAQDDELKYLIKEYHDGLLFFEEMQREVWQPAAADTLGLINYFKKNKKRYAPTKEEAKAGKKKPKVWTDVSEQVVSDYQAEREQAFVEELRKRYPVVIYQEALKTVNNH